MRALPHHVVGGPWPLNAVTEDLPGICGGGQSGMAQTVSPPPASVVAQGRLNKRMNKTARSQFI